MIFNHAVQFCVFVLMFIAAIVTVYIAFGVSAWALIFLYWFVLTVKNLIELINSHHE